MRKITKSFGDTVANDSIDFSVREGEIHVLLGENGAGKTTLMNILFGHIRPDDGVIRIDGDEVEISAPNEAIAHGIGMVHQHFSLVPSFTVAENVMLGVASATNPSFDEDSSGAGGGKARRGAAHAHRSGRHRRRPPHRPPATCGDHQSDVSRCQDPDTRRAHLAARPDADRESARNPRLNCEIRDTRSSSSPTSSPR